MARADGSLRSLLVRVSRIDILVIDDWTMAPLLEQERRDFWEICEDRYQVRSTILTSQLPVSRWHEQIGDPTLADGIQHITFRVVRQTYLNNSTVAKGSAEPGRNRFRVKLVGLPGCTSTRT